MYIRRVRRPLLPPEEEFKPKNCTHCGKAIDYRKPGEAANAGSTPHPGPFPDRGGEGDESGEPAEAASVNVSEDPNADCAAVFARAIGSQGE